MRTEKEPFSAHPYGDELNRGNYREDRRDLWENNTELLIRYNKENLANSGLSVSAFAGGTARKHEVQFELCEYQLPDHT